MEKAQLSKIKLTFIRGNYVLFSLFSDTDVGYLTREQITSERWIDTINRYLPEGVKVDEDSEMHLLDESFIRQVNIEKVTKYFN